MNPENLHKCIVKVLQSTDDGNNLSSGDLKLLETACNNNLSPRGEVVFYQLYYKCVQGYEKPAFHGIEGLTKDGDGEAVYWKGKHIESYSFTNYDEEEKAAIELAKGCQWLEDNGIEVNFTNWCEYRIKGNYGLQRLQALFQESKN